MKTKVATDPPLTPPRRELTRARTNAGSVFVVECWELRRLLPWLLGWGASARVLSPPHVIDRMRREAEALVEAYPEG